MRAPRRRRLQRGGQFNVGSKGCRALDDASRAAHARRIDAEQRRRQRRHFTRHVALRRPQRRQSQPIGFIMAHLLDGAKGKSRRKESNLLATKGNGVTARLPSHWPAPGNDARPWRDQVELGEQDSNLHFDVQSVAAFPIS